MAVQYNPAIVTDGLVLCLDAANLKSYPGSGVTWGGLSNNNDNANLLNGPQYNIQNGGYFILDGSNDYVKVAQTTSSLTTDVTAEVWIYLFSCVNWVRVIGKGDSGNRTFGLGYSNDRRLLWQRYGASSTPNIFPSSPILELNRWYHLAATTSGSNHALYLDGVLIGSASGSGPWFSSSATITIGYAEWDGYHHGRISNARVYNRGLSATEVTQNFNALRGRFGI